MSSRRRRPGVYWLQDRPYEGVTVATTSVGVMPTFTLRYLNQMVDDVNDPASIMWNSAALSTAGLLEVNPRQQMTQDPGWRLMRSVGDWNVAIRQIDVGPEAAPAAAFVKVTIGLCVMTQDPSGNPNDESDWHLGASILPETNASIGQSMSGNTSSWIWRRSWILQNFAAGVDGTAYPRLLGDSAGETKWVGVAEGNMQQYAFGRSSTGKYESMHLGAHFDIKRHVTVKRDEALYWRFHAIDMQGASDSYFALMFNRNYRSLIARPGRPAARR